MELAKNFNAQDAANTWYPHWVNKGYFKSTPNEKPAYTIVIPPPNVTGVLHMGHALNNSVQDVLIRFAKLKGYNTCWVPGTDHASIATEAKVVAMLRDMGIDKNSLSREEFLDYAWQWKEKYGGIILQQLRKLGCSLDWDRTHFTMDTDYYDAVIDVFIDLYNKGYIYRGVKMINWDPAAKTALSNEEVIFKEQTSKLFYIKYFFEDETDSLLWEQKNEAGEIIHSEKLNYLMVATVRPETIFGDVAICVNPTDVRYQHLIGKKVRVPIINRAIEIIADDYVDTAFGTGCLKVTPAHDINDYELGKKYKLPTIDTLREDGTLHGTHTVYDGRDRMEVRAAMQEDLAKEGFLHHVEDYKNQVGFSERTDVVIEQRLSMQWWCNMEKLAKPALDVVMQDDIKFHPAKFKNTYRHWMENIKDWCISRQLRWGHRIPAWYNAHGDCVIAKTYEEACEKIKLVCADELANQTLTQDPDVLDTWFSSWLWPFEVFGWNKQKENNTDLQYYYPTATLVTAPEIIFFWVARMIMAGIEYRGQIPFNQVYFTGIVRDKQGRKMSKSLGNSPDLLQLIDDYGADAVRFGVLISSPAGNDLLFDESTLEQGKLFGNKIWNATKLLHILRDKEQIEDMSSVAIFASQWFESRLHQVQIEIEQDIREFKLSEALKKVYSLIWDDYCSWYLEWIKPAIDQPINAHNISQAFMFMEELMKLLHPFMPFITEEVYHALQNRAEGDDIVVSTLHLATQTNPELLQQGELLQQLITAIRDARVKQQLKPKDPISLYLPITSATLLEPIVATLQKQCYASSVSFTADKIPQSVGFMVNTLACCFTSEKEIDHRLQKEQLTKDLAYYQGFLQSVEKKLSNEKFVQNAKPEVIENERKKQQDALEKLRIIQESLTLLS